MIEFNKACYTGRELSHLKKCIDSGQLQGGGHYTKLCEDWFKSQQGLSLSLLTTSCSVALDMSAYLLEIQPGDEVILPSYNFVSSANSFVARGARLKFVDVRPDTMNIDESLIESAITSKTKAIVIVHYAGVACEMNSILKIAEEHNLKLVEDAAQGMMSTYRDRVLGSMGDIGCYSFHSTKNYTSGGEGGLLITKSDKLFSEAEIIREKGTNRSQFFKGMVDKYSWVGLGSSFIPSETTAAYLYPQLEDAIVINKRRLRIWNTYFKSLEQFAKKGLVDLPTVPEGCEHNAHMFYLKLPTESVRSKYINFMKENKVKTPFHYVPLHSSVAGKKWGEFIGEDKFTTSDSERLVRLPLYYNLSDNDQSKVIDLSSKFLKTL